MGILLLVIGGILGAGSGLLTGWQANRSATKRDQAARAHQLELVREEHASQERMAREALRQERLERTYTEIGIYLSHHADWAGTIQPMMGEPTPPDPVPRNERWRFEALLMNHASPEVRQLLDAWRIWPEKVQSAVITINTARGARDTESSIHKDADRESSALDGYRKAMHEADEAVREQMYSELQGQARAL